MGSCLSDNSNVSQPYTKTSVKTTSSPEQPAAPQGEVIEVELKKTRPACTGMFWRSDPTGKTRLTSNHNWPRDGAKLRGTVVHDSKGKKWLLATHVLQKGSSTWVAAPPGAAMPFQYEQYYLE